MDSDSTETEVYGEVAQPEVEESKPAVRKRVLIEDDNDDTESDEATETEDEGNKSVKQAVISDVESELSFALESSEDEDAADDRESVATVDEGALELPEFKASSFPRHMIHDVKTSVEQYLCRQGIINEDVLHQMYQTLEVDNPEMYKLVRTAVDKYGAQLCTPSKARPLLQVPGMTPEARKAYFESGKAVELLADGKKWKQMIKEGHVSIPPAATIRLGIFLFPPAWPTDSHSDEWFFMVRFFLNLHSSAMKSKKQTGNGCEGVRSKQITGQVETDVYELTPYQLSVQYLMHERGPCKTLLAWHSTGSGKTLSALAVASTYVKSFGNRLTLPGDKKMVAIFPTVTVKSQFLQSTIQDPGAIGQFVRYRVRLAWHNKGIKPGEGTGSLKAQEIAEEAISRAANSIFNCLTYGEAGGVAQRERHDDDHPWRGTLVIFDEAHNMLAPHRLYADRPNQKKVLAIRATLSWLAEETHLDNEVGTRVLLLTATPFSVNTAQMLQLISIISHPEERYSEEEIACAYRAFLSVLPLPESLIRKARPYISYYDASYDHSKFPTIEHDDKHNFEAMSRPWVVRVPLSYAQREVVQAIRGHKIAPGGVDRIIKAKGERPSMQNLDELDPAFGFSVGVNSKSKSKRGSKEAVSGKQCKADEVLNPATNRCVKRKGALGRKILAQNPDAGRSKSISKSKSKSKSNSQGLSRAELVALLKERAGSESDSGREERSAARRARKDSKKKKRRRNRPGVFKMAGGTSSEATSATSSGTSDDDARSYHMAGEDLDEVEQEIQKRWVEDEESAAVQSGKDPEKVAALILPKKGTDEFKSLQDELKACIGIPAMMRAASKKGSVANLLIRDTPLLAPKLAAVRVGLGYGSTGKQLVFSHFKPALRMLAQFLEFKGWKRVEKWDSKTLQRLPKNTSTFALLGEAEQGKRATREVIKFFNSERNSNGKYIRVLLAPVPEFGEGVDFTALRGIHLMDPPMNASDFMQYVGRAQRLCSHKMLPVEQRKFRVTLYVGVVAEQVMRRENEPLDNQPAPAAPTVALQPRKCKRVSANGDMEEKFVVHKGEFESEEKIGRRANEELVTDLAGNPIDVLTADMRCWRVVMRQLDARRIHVTNFLKNAIDCEMAEKITGVACKDATL